MALKGKALVIIVIHLWVVHMANELMIWSQSVTKLNILSQPYERFCDRQGIFNY